MCAGCVSGVCCCFCPCGLLCVSIEDTHVQSIGHYAARCVSAVGHYARSLCAAHCVSAVCRLCERCVLLFLPVCSAVCVLLLRSVCFVASWWSASTCSLKSNDPTQKSSLIEDTHANYFFFMGAYIARPRCRLKIRFARKIFPTWGNYKGSADKNLSHRTAAQKDKKLPRHPQSQIRLPTKPPFLSKIDLTSDLMLFSRYFAIF